MSVRADLQTASQRINLVPGTGADISLHTRYCTLYTVHCTVYTAHFVHTTHCTLTLHTAHCALHTAHCTPRDSLAPGSTIDQVLHHEVKELGTHILVCEVSGSLGQRWKFLNK